MIFVAKIITILIMIKGITALLFPNFVKKSAEKFNKRKDSHKRITGMLAIVPGLLLITLSRVCLLIPLIHWIITVTGIYMVLAGIFLIIIPGVMGKISIWFFIEKGPTSLMGLIVFIGGMVLFFLI